MPNLPLLHTTSLRWREPDSTNPRGWLAGDVNLHPAGGLEARDDDDGTGVAVNLLGEPELRDWPSGTPINQMPLHVSTLSELWAPPYPTLVTALSTAAPLSAGAPTGAADQVSTIAGPHTLEITNTSPYDMLVMRRVLVRDARLVNPGAPVTYGLIIDGATGAPWPLFSGVPDTTLDLTVTNDTATIDSVPNTPFVASIAEAAVAVAGEHHYSGGIQLPSLILAAGETHEFTAATAILFQTATAPFEVQVGETTMELLGWAIADGTFGSEA